jgi:hypothetical protein
MSFPAVNFIYDGIISSEYGIRISSDSSGTNNPGADIQLYTQALYRRPVPYLLGIQQTPVLTFPVHISVPQYISTTESSVISSWLFGQMNYKKLQIIFPDMQYVYYNCLFTTPQVERIGNVIRGYSTNVICDSPFAWEYPKTISYTYTNGGYSVVDNINIYNSSDNADYTYPSLTFTMNIFGGDLSITNASDNNREFLFTGLDANEIITVNNDIQEITSSVTGINRLSDFNYQWMRYIPKMNNLVVSGNIASLSFTHQFAKKIS